MNGLKIMDNKAERRKFLGSLIVPLLLVVVMWAVKIIEVSLNIDFDRYGVTPHTAHGLIGIITLPFLHGSWEHLLSNSVPILVLGTALYYCYPTLANRVLLITYLASGLITWCIGNPESTHIGASALVYGLNLSSLRADSSVATACLLSSRLSWCSFMVALSGA